MSETWLQQRAVQKRAKFQETGANQNHHVEYLLQQHNMPFSKSKTSEETQPPQIYGNQNRYYQYFHNWRRNKGYQRFYVIHTILQISHLPHIQHCSWPDIIGVVDLRIVFQNEDIVALYTDGLKCLTFLCHIKLIALAVLCQVAIITRRNEDGLQDEKGRQQSHHSLHCLQDCLD